MKSVHATIDLNLLKTFDALMEHRSVTRAAQHLGVTQSAVSHALGRLRRTLDDPLLLRGPTGLQPTARAEEMANGVKRGLIQLGDALSRPAFDPRTTQRNVTIAAGAYFCALLIPSLVDLVRKEAPGITVRIVPVAEKLPVLLDRGALDLALGGTTELPIRFVVEPLYREKMVWIAAPGSTVVREKHGFDAIPDELRITIASGPPFESAGRPGDTMAQSYPSRDRPEWEAVAPASRAMTVYDSQTAVDVVTRTDLIARVPEKVAAVASGRGRIAILDWIEEDASFEIAMIWHARQRSDPCLVWLRDKIRTVAAGNGVT